MKDFIKQIITKVLIFAAIAAMAVGLYFLRREKEPPPPPPPTVTISKPVIKDVTNYYDFTGNTAAIEFVEIRARVEGFLESIHFKESDIVKNNELLFLIDPSEYIARRDEALADLKAAKAELERAQVDLERVQEAIKTNAVSEREVSTRRAQRDKADAAVKGAQAALIEAEIKLGYTRVSSPITGRTSRKMVDLGNLVGAEEKTLLTTVVRMDPMYVYFNVSELILLEVLEGKPVKEKRDPDVPFFVGLANQEGHPIEGNLDYIDNIVDPETGTIKVRGVIPNPDQAVLPGMFVRVRTPARKQKDAILVKEIAIGTDIAGKYILIVGKDNIVEQRDVKMGPLFEDMRVIAEGIEPGEEYIIDGLLDARPGKPVTPQTEDQIKKKAEEKNGEKEPEKPKEKQ